MSRAPEDQGADATRFVLPTSLCAGALFAYLFVAASALLGPAPRLRVLVPVAAAGFVASYLLARRFAGRGAANGLKAAALLCATSLACLLALDVSYAIYLNATTAAEQSLAAQRERDPTLWSGELLPHMCYPTEQNFQTFKPGVRVSGDVYGHFYQPAFLRSPTLMSAVLERRHVSYVIDEHGFRETTPLAKARLFVLGDSFAIGFNTDQELSWAKLLEGRLGRPLYDLGVSGSSPRQQLLLLEHMLRSQGAMQVDRLLWMVFEGNDLEDSYDDLAPRARRGSPGDLLRGTLVETLASIPERVRQESVIDRLLTRRVLLAAPGALGAGPYSVDGLRLSDPLYRSAKFGWMMFEREYLERATKPESYVLGHAHRALLDRTLQAMAELAKRRNFKVVVLLAPSAPRLYASAFAGTPALSARPYFLEYVRAASRRVGFDVVDLGTLLAPFAKEELLYYRDDSHWNERGNAVVAEAVARAVFAQ